MRTVAAIPALGLLAGSLAGFLLPEIIQPLASTLLICGAAAALWAWRISSARAVAMTVAAAFAAGGALLAADAWQKAWRPTLRVAFEELARGERAQAVLERRVRPEDDEAFATITGVLRADASRTESGVSLSVAVDGIESGQEGQEGRDRQVRPVRGGLLVTVVGSLGPSSIDDWRAGRRVRMPVQLHRPTRYLDPGVPDNERLLARSGTTLVGTVKSGALVEMIGRGRWWSEWAGRVRHFARRAIGRFVGRWSRQSAAIVTAIVIGDRAGLDDDVQRRLQEAGTYHVIAISGGNIAILAGLLLGAFRVAGCLGRGAMIAAIGLLVAYASLVGGGASVDRATLMAIVYFGARAFDQRSPPLNALWVVAAMLVATDPLSIADPAFGLTFGATLGILIVGPVITTTMRPQNSQRSCFSAVLRVLRCIVVLRGMFVASLAAEAMLFPIGALVFSRVTFAGLALNFLAIPLMAVAQVAGMAVVPIALVSTRLATAAGWMAHIGAGGLVWSADLVRFAPVLTYRVAPPGVDRGGPLLRIDRRVLGALAATDARVRQRGAAVCRARPTRHDGDRSAHRGVDPRPTVGAAGRAWRWLAARDVSRRWTGRQRPAAIPPRLHDAGGRGRARRISHASTSATASSLPCCAKEAFDVSITSCSRTAIRITWAEPRRSCASFGRARCGRGFPCRDSSRSRRCAFRRRPSGRTGGMSIAGIVFRSMASTSRRSTRRRPIGSGRRCGTTTRWCSTCAGATSRCC